MGETHKSEGAGAMQTDADNHQGAGHAHEHDHGDGGHCSAPGPWTSLGLTAGLALGAAAILYGVWALLP